MASSHTSSSEHTHMCDKIRDLLLKFARKGSIRVQDLQYEFRENLRYPDGCTNKSTIKIVDLCPPYCTYFEIVYHLEYAYIKLREHSKQAKSSDPLAETSCGPHEGPTTSLPDHENGTPTKANNDAPPPDEPHNNIFSHEIALAVGRDGPMFGVSRATTHLATDDIEIIDAADAQCEDRLLAMLADLFNSRASIIIYDAWHTFFGLGIGGSSICDKIKSAQLFDIQLPGEILGLDREATVENFATMTGHPAVPASLIEANSILQAHRYALWVGGFLLPRKAVCQVLSQLSKGQKERVTRASTEKAHEAIEASGPWGRYLVPCHPLLHDGARRVIYLKSKRTFGSFELWNNNKVAKPELPRRPLVHQDSDTLTDIIPWELCEPEACTGADFRENLSDIILDIGSREHYYLHCNRRVIVSKEHLQDLCSHLDIGFDNRAIVPGHLHRISVKRNRAKEVTGATLRMGRYVTNHLSSLRDLLTSDASEQLSLLILGPPGTGKTTVVRELCRLMSEELKLEVMIVDTSNEIAGEEDTPHRSVGHARQLQVGHREQQAGIMIEALQNHTPDVIVIDEIGRKQEVEAASTIKERKAAIVGSAHGTFLSLLRNEKLKGLLGGSTSVTLGDTLARLSNGGNKVQTQRKHDPVFDVVIELPRNQRNSWRVYRDTAEVVDAIHQGRPCTYEDRYLSEDGILLIKRVTENNKDVVPEPRRPKREWDGPDQ